MKKYLIIATLCTALALLAGCTSTTTNQNGTVISTKQVSQKQRDEVYALVKGNNYLRIGELNNAINQYKIASQINPKNTTTLNQIGVLYGESGNYSESLIYLNKAYSINKSSAETLYNLSYLNYIQNSYPTAYGYIVQIQPQDYSENILNLKFNLAMNTQNYSVAYDTFNKVLSYQKVLEISQYNQYVSLLKTMGRSKDIYPFMVSLNTAFPNNEKITLYFSNYFISNGAYEKAATVLKEYAIKNGYSDPVLLQLSIVAYDEKNYIQALNYLNLVSKTSQYDQDIIMQKIQIYTAMGQISRADELKKVLGVSYEPTN